jgi:hypothetical protein
MWTARPTAVRDRRGSRPRSFAGNCPIPGREFRTLPDTDLSGQRTGGHE